MSESQSIPVETCTNCGAPLGGDYCHVCGQRSKDPRRLVIGLAQDVIVETLSVDSKLARTIWTVYRAPGRLAKAYLSGQRVRFTPPFRLYLFTSVLFFAALFWMLTTALGLDAPPDTAGDTSAGMESEFEPPAASETSVAPDPPGMPDLSFGDTDDDTDPNVNRGMSEGTDWGENIELRLEAAWDRLQDDPRLFVAQARENIPRVLLIAPLMYALQLVILYIYRRKFLLYDHLITSLYMHAALYAFLLAIILLSQIPGVGVWLAVIVGIWGFIQPFAVLRQVYGSNWFSVFLKGTTIHIGYIAMLTVLVTAGLGVALYNS
ncbi:MAG: DUF3667 domain-containing protein [Pseudomonadota bacterium]